MPIPWQPCRWVQVVDVGGGTGFCTQGIVKAGIPPANITLIDQSPQQVGGQAWRASCSSRFWRGIRHACRRCRNQLQCACPCRLPA